MQFTRSLPLVTSFLVLVTAQYETPEDIPICAYSPIQNIINAAGCQVTETSCFCAKPNIIPDFAEAVVEACDGTVNSAEVSSFASSFCVITSSATSAATTSLVRGPTPTPAGFTDPFSNSNTLPTTISRTSSAISPSGVASTTSRSSSPGLTATSSTPAATATPSDQSTGSPNLGVSALALAIAIGGLTWVFGEL